MKFVVWLLVCVLYVLADESPPLNVKPTVEEPQQQFTSSTGERGGRFINIKQFYHNSVETNEVEPENKEDPNSALKNVYTDCVVTFSIPCLQKKFLVFLDKLGRMDSFSLFGDFLTVKRTTKETMKPLSEKVVNARMNSEEELNSLVEYSIDRFFSTHKVQIKLPFGFTVLDEKNNARSFQSERQIINIGFTDEYTQGRAKRIKKKVLMLLVMMAKAKLAFLAPLAVILIKIKAIKALFFAKFALFLAIFSAIRKVGLGAAGLGALGLGGAGLGAATLGTAGTVGTTVTQTGHVASVPQGMQKIVIIHDPHQVTSGQSHTHTHSHGHTGYDSYGPSGGAGGGGGGGWSTGGGDGYGSGGYGGYGGGSWGRSWSPFDKDPRLLNSTAMPTT